MSDDYYIFNPTLYILKGERTNKRYRIGDDVLVKVVRSDKKMREIAIVLQSDFCKKIEKISIWGFTNHRTCDIIYLADEATA